MLIKASYLFSFGETEKAEQIFSVVQKEKLSARFRLLADDILKSDRAMTIGDYATVRIFSVKKLGCKFPKPDNLTRLVCNYFLALSYDKDGKPEDALRYYEYCRVNSGQTAIKQACQIAIDIIKF